MSEAEQVSTAAEKMACPKNPGDPVVLTLDAEERAVVYGVGYYAVLDPATEGVALDREPDDGIERAVAHLRDVMDLYDQLGWERKDERKKFKVKAPWLFLMETLGAIERDIVRSLEGSIRDLRWAMGEFERDENMDGSTRDLEGLRVITNLIRRAGGRWQGTTGRDFEDDFRREHDMRFVLTGEFGEGCGPVYDRIRSEQPLLTFSELFAAGSLEWAGTVAGAAAALGTEAL